MSDSKGPELTVVIATHNRAEVIEEALTSVAAQVWDGDWDILIVDNDSTDDTPQILERWIDKMPVATRVVTATERHNPSYTRNTAVVHADAENLAFVDDDDVIGTGWVAAIGTAMRTHELVGSKFDYDLLNDATLARVNHFQAERLGRHFGVEVVASGGIGCRRALWNEVGGSNEAFRTAEDTDFSLRVARLGNVTPHFCAAATYHVRLRDGSGAAFRRGNHRGQADVQLFVAHRDAFDVRADSPLKAIARWVRLLLQLPSIVRPANRVHWAEQAGRRTGRVGASASERAWFP